jgi:glycosyltransferase involved in cell wall biosynthesis
MNVLVNGLLLNGRFSGVQYSVEYTLHAMKSVQHDHHIELILPSEYQGHLKEEYLCLCPRHIRNRLQRIAWEHIRLPRYIINNKADFIYHAPGYILPYNCPVPSVVTVHDLIAIKYPLWCQYESEWYFRLFFRKGIEQANKIIAVSHTVKTDIIETYAVDPEKIEVVYHGISNAFRKINDKEKLAAVASKYNLPDQYLLFVGNLEPKKNIVNIIRAFHQLMNEPGFNHKLVIVGRKGWKYESIFKVVNDLNLQKDIFFTGYVPLEDLPSIYSMATVFVFPSLYEGFGLPVLEAMACGLPVITSNRGALPEISGDSAIHVDPTNINDIAEAISGVVSDRILREELAVKGLYRASKYNWNETAKNTLKVYTSISSPC